VPYLLSALAGAALPLAFAPFGHFWVAPLSYAVLFYLWQEAPRPRRAFALGFVYGCASFGFGTYWTFIAVRVFGGAPIALALFLTIGLTLVLAAFVALAGYIAARLRTPVAVAALAVMPAMFVLAEWLRGFAFTGFGWLAAGYSQTDTWLMAYAPLGGIHLISWAVLVSAGALVTLYIGRRRERVAAAAALAALWAGAFALRDVGFSQPQQRMLDVALTQGAIAQDYKWRPEQMAPTLALYEELTKQSLGADLIIWPEAAIPTLIDYVDEYLERVRRTAAEAGGTVLAGVLRLPPGVESPDTFQNILVALTEEPQVYVKRHLVPFGEYFPVPDFIRSWMRLMSLPYTDAVPGAADQPPITAAGEKLAITICYEDVFPAEQLHYLPEATMLVNVSNDAWFGDSIAPHQHLQIARVRAAEAGRFMLRATNTGVTAVIDPRGAMVATLPQFRAGVLKATVQGYTGLTPYARVGNYAVVILALVVLAAGYVATWVAERERARS
jgi:apolipoprotein N-acyltransferase